MRAPLYTLTTSSSSLSQQTPLNNQHQHDIGSCPNVSKRGHVATVKATLVLACQLVTRKQADTEHALGAMSKYHKK